MKKLTLILSLILFAMLNATLINTNPDPNGEKWLAGGERKLTPKDQEMLAKMKRLLVKETPKDLPTRIDNTEQPYFRGIFNQEGGSCSQASGIAYNFTYEYNFSQGTEANIEENQFPSHYTWNFLNGGVGSGSTYFDGWDILSKNGCPTVSTYGGLWPDDYYYESTLWMNGYQNYLSGMNYRVDEVLAIELNTPEGLNTLKNWFFDHLNGAEAGGLANFSAGVTDEDGYQSDYIADDYENGKLIVTAWGNKVNHAMTFVGYDDQIKYDYNNDGQFTNDIDINDDGVVDMKDWEVGALIMANTWGVYWGNDGKAYVPYRLLAFDVNNGGIRNKTAYVITVKNQIEPKLTLKAEIKHASREKIKIFAGISKNLEDEIPEHTISYPIFNFQGGDHSFRVDSPDKFLEIGLDVSPLLSFVDQDDAYKVFLGIKEVDPLGTTDGQIKDFEIYLHDGTTTKVYGNREEFVILDNQTTYIGVTKDLTVQKPIITTEEIPVCHPGQEFNFNFEAEGANDPYQWSLIYEYEEQETTDPYPENNGTEIEPSSYDDSVTEINLPFEILFYGKKYDRVFVSTDGSILFEDGFEYIRSEEAIVGNKCITAYGSDLMLYPESGDFLRYKIEDNSATFLWKTSKFEEPEIDLEFAIKIEENGTINFYYSDNFTQNIYYAAGISNGDGENYLITQTSNLPNPENKSIILKAEEFPLGLNLAQDGSLSGIVNEPNKTWNIKVRVTDQLLISNQKDFIFRTDETSIAENKPQAIELYQNYPNPFNPKTTIAFKLNKDSKVKLSIYNIKGELVEMILNRKLTKGLHQVNFRGDHLNSGVYFCRLETAGVRRTTKIALVK